MERTDHVMLVSGGATDLAKLCKIDLAVPLRPTKEKIDRYNLLRIKLKKTWPRNYELLLSSLDKRQTDLGTVGAVAIDRHANVASAVSTGGRWFKMHGRVGDSAIIGAGIYADNGTGAACATGNGEFITRLCLSKYTCDQMKRHNPSQSTRKAIDLLTNRFGSNSGGIIAVDAKGKFGLSMNTRSMPVAMKNSKDKGKTRIAFEKTINLH
jgi:beta-aspartyl-peptidase (threonine type)